MAVRGADGQQDLQLRSELGVADRHGPDQERLHIGARVLLGVSQLV